ncbi:MAG: hypothetical protein SVU69_10575 [Pseudomonadota bacterium]|nr:hypothetical protein [Pseudomonadota bacterium]
MISKLPRANRHTSLRIALLALACFTAGCVSDGALAPPRSAETGLVYGRLSAGQIGIYSIYLYREGHHYLVPFTAPTAYPDAQGRFVLENAPPGDYFIAGFSDGRRNYWVTQTAGPATVPLTPGGLAYLGSFVVEPRPRPELDQREVRLRPDPAADEREIIQWLLARVAGTAWENRLRQREVELDPPRPSPDH